MWDLGWLWVVGLVVGLWWILNGLFGLNSIFNLGRMLVVFGYTTAMATEQYPEMWVSSKTILGAFLSGLVIEVTWILYTEKWGGGCIEV